MLIELFFFQNLNFLKNHFIKFRLHCEKFKYINGKTFRKIYDWDDVIIIVKSLNLFSHNAK